MRQGKSRAQQSFYDRQYSRIAIDPFREKIAPGELLYFGGSCFAENLYDFWQNHYLPSALSPFGSIYNPVSLRECFNLLCNERRIDADELFNSRGLWSHSLFNSSVSRGDRHELLGILNGELDRHREVLRESSWVILTLGTAYVYEEIASGRIVNNCHRRPGSDFRRYALSPGDVRGALGELGDALRSRNPSVRMILSLSPVRHLRDSASENSLSKAVLRCGIEDYLNSTGGEKDSYFPSYEILLDELRDYRWYADDLSHPSRRAVSYIMERFCETAGDSSLQSYLDEAVSLSNLMNHRVMLPGSREAHEFEGMRDKKREAFAKRYPFALII